MLILRMFLVGWIVLAGAILLNLLAGALHLATWYTFLQSVSAQGLVSALRTLRWQDAVFLFLVYPLGLGGLAWAGGCLARQMVG